MTPRGGAAAVTPAGTAAMQDAEKTAVDPKIFIVLGLLVAAALIGSFTTGIIGGGGGNNNTMPDITPIAGGEGGGPPPMPPAQVTVNVAPPPFTPSQTTTNPTVTGPVVAQSKIVVPPDPRQTTGTMGIMVNTPNISPAQALALAKAAQQNAGPGGRWTGMQVVVFNNQDAALIFRKYQSQRKGAKLTPNEYQDLANQGMWNSVPAYYETQGKTGTPYYPASSPKGWWSRR